MTPRAIWRILRLPLFITAVADVIAGYTVAMLPRLDQWDGSRVALLAGASAGLYLFGMVQNDLVDIRRDRLLKVPRPLVTGEIGIGWAVVLLIVTAGGAAVCAERLSGAALVLAIGTFATICLYNLSAKHGPPYVAMTVMGLCRFLNFGIGVAAAIGYPRDIGVESLLPSGPLWAKQGLALFFATATVTGYSILARSGATVSTRPWKAVFVLGAAAGFAMIALSTMIAPAAAEDPSSYHLVAPVARVLAVLLLAGLWPGGLWSAAGSERKPEEYAPFIERALYWFIVLDAAFVLDALLIR